MSRFCSQGSPLKIPLILLKWLGAHARGCLVVIVLLGVALPAVGNSLKPLLPTAVFLLLLNAFCRIDPASFRALAKRPLLVTAAICWTSVAIPVLVGTGGLLLDLEQSNPELFTGLILQALASPIMASPALAMLMGLDASLILMAMVGSTALLPVTAPLFAHLFLGTGLVLAPAELAVKLFILIAGSGLVASWVQRFFGLAAIHKRNQELDGANVIILFVFAAVIMCNVGGSVLQRPSTVLYIALLTGLMALTLQLLSSLLFWPAGRDNALAMGIMVSQRNMGLLLAVTSSVLPDLAWLYFAMAQFPIYLSAWLLKPVISRLQGGSQPSRS